MSQRINFRNPNSDAYRAMAGLQAYVAATDLPKTLVHLIYTRVSQINGCAFCLDIHTREALRDGEDAQRLYTLSAWRETTFFTEQEQAALALAEHMTRVSENGVPDAIYDEVAKHFEEEQIVPLMVAICAINTWNRMVISTGTHPTRAKATS